MRGLHISRFAVLSICAACGGDMNMPPSTVPIAAVTTDALYVVNGGDHSISVIDTTRNVVTGTIAMKNAMFPHHIYLSADRASALVAIPGMDLSMGHDVNSAGMKGAVLLVDAPTGTTRAAVMLGMMNHNAIFAPGGTEVWTSQMMAPGMVLVLDAQTLATKQSIDVGDMPAEITFTRDGKYALVADGMSDAVSVVDASSKAVVKTISVGKGPVGAWPGADGMMYVDAEEAKTVSVIDPATLAVARTIELGFTPGMVGTPPGRGEVWVTDADNGKVVFYGATGAKTGEVSTGPGAHGIAFSTDASTAYVTNQFANTVSVIGVAAHAVTATIQVGQKPNGLVFRAR